MERADILEYNGGLVESVDWCGNPVDVMRVSVGDVDAEWSAGGYGVSFSPSLYGIGAGGTLGNYAAFSVDDPELKQYVSPTQNGLSSMFVIHVQGRNYGRLCFEGSSYLQQQLALVDDRIAIVEGRIVASNIYIYPSEDPSMKTKISTLANSSDEDNTVFAEPMLITKVMKIPSSGVMAVRDRFVVAAYTFDDDKLVKEPSVAVLTRSDEGVIANELHVGGVYDDGSARISLIKSGATDYALSYEVSENTTRKFREWSVIFGYGTMTERIVSGSYALRYGTRVSTYDSEYKDATGMLHLVQEPYEKNRVYYGNRNPRDKMFDPSYADTGSSDYEYHVFFEHANSRVMSGASDSIVVSQYYCVAYPNDFDYEIDLSSVEHYTVLSTSYVWGGREYTLLSVYGLDTYSTPLEIPFRRL